MSVKAATSVISLWEESLNGLQAQICFSSHNMYLKWR